MGCSGCNTNIDLDRPAMLGTYDWLNDIPDTTNESNIVEIRFKGTRPVLQVMILEQFH